MRFAGSIFFTLGNPLMKGAFAAGVEALSPGRQIRVRCDRGSGKPAHLECPSEGCLAVPLEWIMLDSPSSRTPKSSPLNEPADPTVVRAQISESNGGTLFGETFGFLRVPPGHC